MFVKVNNNENLVIKNRITSRSGSKMITFILIVFGLTGILMTLISIMLAFTEGFDFGMTAGAVFFIVFPIYFTINASIMNTSIYKGYVSFDNRNKMVLFSRRKNRAITFALAYHEVSHIHIVSLRRTGPHKLIYYAVFLLKKDGSEVWIDEIANEEYLVGFIGDLADFTGFAVRDESGLNLNRNRGKDHTSPGPEIELTRPKHTSMVIEELPEGCRISFVKSKTSFKTRVLYFLTWLLFGGLPGLKIMDIIKRADEDSIGSGAITGIVFLSVFIILSFGLLLVGLFVSYRHHRLTISPKGLLVESSTSSSLYIKNYPYALDIPARYIKHVRVNREAWGNFFLSLVTSTSFKIPKACHTALPLLGSFSKENIAARLNKDERLIPLWESLAHQRPRRGVSAYDLMYIKQLIQKTIGLNEGR